MSAGPRVLMVQPAIRPPGGGNCVAAWMLEALRDDHRVSVVTLEALDLEGVNRFYGTSLRPGDFTWIRAYPPLARLLARPPIPLTMLRTSLLFRAARRMAPDFDLVVTANNEADLGTPCIQYIHFPWHYRPRPLVDMRWYHKSPVLDGYYRLCEMVSAVTRDGVARNLSLVNSDWTGEVMSRCYGVRPVTLHPPVPGVFPEVPWGARASGFVCVGRISPEKELDRVIDIVAAVRARVRDQDVRLHIVGTPGKVASYNRHVYRRARSMPWISLHRNMAREDLVRLLGSQRYAIHGMREEHFGIAVAEFVRAGCIPWVPRGGGQVEIVGRDERFLYDSVEECAAKIVATLGDPTRQEAQREYLAARRDLYTPERFVRAFRDLVARFRA